MGPREQPRNADKRPLSIRPSNGAPDASDQIDSSSRLTVVGASGAPASADLRRRHLRRHVGGDHRRGAGEADGQVGRHRRPDKHLGGLSSGGLGFTDTGNKAVIGGLSREFYHRVWKHYDSPAAWKWQKREEYGNKGQGTPAIDGDAADDVDLRAARGRAGLRGPRAASTASRCTATNGSTARAACRRTARGSLSITTLSGKTYTGRMFIDATYEGDLMAAAGVDYHVGREAQSDLRREVERRADRRAAPPASLRRAASRRSARTSCPAIRRAACCRASAPSRPASTARATSACRRTASACA